VVARAPKIGPLRAGKPAAGEEIFLERRVYQRVPKATFDLNFQHKSGATRSFDLNFFHKADLCKNFRAKLCVAPSAPPAPRASRADHAGAAPSLWQRQRPR
jgi:hypothetical protein